MTGIRTAVIGVGSMGGNHARVLSQMSDLRAVCDSDTGRAKEITKKFSCSYYSSSEEMLKKEDIEAVVIANPTIYHLQEVEKCAARGVNILVEKPIADTVENGQMILDLASRAGVVLSVGMIERHNPIVKATREIIDKGGLGQIVTLSSKRVSSYPARITDVGVITDLGVHDIDVLRYLSSSEVSSVYALGGSVKAKGLIDHANILLEFRNGTKGIMELSWLTPMKIRSVRVTGLKAYAEMDYIDQELKISSSSAGKYDLSDSWRIPQNYEIRTMRVAMEEPLKRELQDFLDAVRDPGTGPLVSGPDGLKDLIVAKAAERSIAEGSKVML
ncbi:MAG: Gfo/Idh/MocA family oxidoreductase [Candidatus Thermoplasmatota archaeon]|nr:Gfo/Idh/MocA family oxidoreductase [Candidatus Thermoplasmatota archaeon]